MSRITVTTAGKKCFVAATLLIVVLAAMVAAGAFLGPASGQDLADEPTATPTAVATEVVVRTTLSETKKGVGQLSYGEPWTLPLEAEGTVTNRHEKGTVIESGQPVIWIDNKPVELALGTTPLYRPLELLRKRLTGPDVTQLQNFLIGRGFTDKDRLEADGEFGATTQRAVKAWQKASGREQSGRVDRSQLLFSPAPVRIDSVPRVGATFGELQVTEATQRITVAFDNKSRSFLDVGSAVSIDAGAGERLEATIEKVEGVVGDDGSSQLQATVIPVAPLGATIERVTVTAVRDVASEVLVVPVRAIVALAGGGYAVEVDTAAGPELRRADLGAVVDAQAEVAGDFTEGDRVIVPTESGQS